MIIAELDAMRTDLDCMKKSYESAVTLMKSKISEFDNFSEKLNQLTKLIKIKVNNKTTTSGIFTTFSTGNRFNIRQKALDIGF